ncbi:hypothetical protein [Sandaracinus amylolyticus]|uniref:hypothetical protein n=1 Tax=Sandaracinus amylolyticus TaxID=927083 RepID=UPI001F2FAC80|nr:hypothetical protein [Sandaracinus amylolyticus]
MRPSPRLHAPAVQAVLAALPLALWLAFHLGEQWSVFGGRDAWIARMQSTSRGPLAIAIELVVIGALSAWAVLTVRALVRRDALSGAAREDDAGIVRALGRLAPVVSIASIVFLAIHVATMWAPKLAGADLVAQWVTLTHALGRPEVLVLHAVGLTAISLHLVVAIPAALEALGLVRSERGRRSAMLVAATFALCAWVLAAQLVGWLGTGAGTFWGISVTE